MNRTTVNSVVGNPVLRTWVGTWSYARSLDSCRYILWRRGCLVACFIRVVLRPLAAERLSRIETNRGEREEEAVYTHNLSNQYLASNCVAKLGINGVVQDVWCVNV